MADNLDKLVAMLAESGTDATREQAERLAQRVSGSVEAHIAMIERRRAELADYKPLKGEASDKFSAPLSYEVEPPPK